MSTENEVKEVQQPEVDEIEVEVTENEASSEVSADASSFLSLCCLYSSNFLMSDSFAGLPRDNNFSALRPDAQWALFGLISAPHEISAEEAQPILPLMTDFPVVSCERATCSGVSPMCFTTRSVAVCRSSSP